MITHAQYQAENPLPYFPAPLDLDRSIAPFSISTEKPLPARVVARMETTESTRIEKFRWMRDKGPMTTTEIAIAMHTSNGNIHQQLNRLVSSGHVVKAPVGRRFTYEWAL